MLSALQSSQPPPTEAILTALINEMAAIPGRVVLVLDDYHLTDAQPVHDALTFLLRHLPPHPGPGRQCQGMHLVIATREDPLLPLARLRARGQLTELRATGLRFSSSEAAEFPNRVMGLDLATGELAMLERRTEGWIVSLQLAAKWTSGQPTTSLRGAAGPGKTTPVPRPRGREGNRIPRRGRATSPLAGGSTLVPDGEWGVHRRTRHRHHWREPPPQQRARDVRKRGSPQYRRG